jgi:hypothetical protein
MRVSQFKKSVRALNKLGYQDKHEVEKYKADIKAQLTRAGLIRGQPRSSLPQNQSSQRIVPSQSYAIPSHQAHAARSISRSRSDASSADRPLNVSPPQHLRHQISSSMTSYVPRSIHNFDESPLGPLPSPVRRMPVASFSEPNLNQPNLHAAPDFNSHTPPIHYSPSSTSTMSTMTTPDAIQYDPFSVTFGFETHAGLSPQPPHLSLPVSTHLQQGLSPTAQTPTPAAFSGQSSVQGLHVLYYFEHVRRMQYIFAGNSITNITYSVCKLPSIHYSALTYI